MSAINEFCMKCNEFRKRYCDGNRNTCMSILFEHIEALQQENEQLKADCDRILGEVQELTIAHNRLEKRLQISPFGDDKIDELEQALEFCKHENEQLRAQVAAEVEALRKAREALEERKYRLVCQYKYLELGCENCEGCDDIKEAIAEIEKSGGNCD